MWQGLSLDTDDHEYYCAHHPSVLLATVSLRDAVGAEGIRRYGGTLYQCWLCSQEEERSIQRFLKELTCRGAIKEMRW